MHKDNGQITIIDTIKGVEVVPVEVNVNTGMPKGVAEAFATANTATKEIIHTALDRLAATSPQQAARISKISLVQTFTVTPDAVRLDIELKE